MRTLVILICTTALFASCTVSKSYLDKKNEVRAISGAIKKLQKSPTDAEATEALPILYERILNEKLAKIELLQNKNNLDQWQQILNVYNELQKIYDDIVTTPAALQLVTPEDFRNEIMDVRYSGAEAWYNAAEVYDSSPYKSDIKKAYEHFRKSNNFIANYKDVAARMADARARSILNIVINPVSANLGVSLHGISMFEMDKAGDAFQSQLLRELNTGLYNDQAVFLSDRDAQRANIVADRIVNVYLSDFDFPSPHESSTEREVSRQVETGKDTSGKAIYKTYTAKIKTTTLTYNVSIRMTVVVTDLERNRTVRDSDESASTSWTEQVTTFTGSRRALSSSDIDLLDKNLNQQRSLFSVLTELYQEVYSDVKTDIEFSMQY